MHLEPDHFVGIVKLFCCGPQIEQDKPGDILMVDIIKNPAQCELTLTSLFSLYLLITEGCSCFSTPISIQNKAVKEIFRTLKSFATWFKPRATFNLSKVVKIHGNASSGFKAMTFIYLCIDP
jgi:hypothetical protein